MGQGLVLLVVGMATVFAFLVLLVIAMQASARFFKRFAHRFPDDSMEASVSAKPPATAIAVALAAIRAKRG